MSICSRSGLRYKLCPLADTCPRASPGQHSPTNDPLLAAEDYQPSSLDESSGGVKGALKTAINKMTPGDGVAGPNSAIGDGATGGSGFGYGGNLA